MITIKNRHTSAIMYQFDREYFDNANLGGANFTEADLRLMVMSECYLGDARFVGADLRCAVFSNTDLRRADFTGADMAGCQFRWCNLDQAKLGGICLTVAGQ